MKIDVSALSHTGLLRDNNEDQFFVTKMSRALRDAAVSSLPPGDVPERAEEVNYVHRSSPTAWAATPRGELASRLAISSLVGLALELAGLDLQARLRARRRRN